MADDGIGLRIVEYISENKLNTDFEVVDLADSGIRLLDYFTSNTEKILLVDSVLSGKKPGDYFFFSPDDVESGKYLSAMTTHEGDILKIIELGKALGYSIPPMNVMGIEPSRIEPVMELSQVLKNNFKTYVDAAMEKIRG